MDDFLDILHGVVLAMPNRSTADTTTTLGPVALALLGLCLGSERLFFLLSLILSFMITLPLLFLLFCRKRSDSGFFLFLILAFLLALAFALAFVNVPTNENPASNATLISGKVSS